MLGVEGTVNGKAFQSYIEPVVAPERGRGRIVVMDNFSLHKSEWVEFDPSKKGARHSYFSRPTRLT